MQRKRKLTNEALLHSDEVVPPIEKLDSYLKPTCPSWRWVHFGIALRRVDVGSIRWNCSHTGRIDRELRDEALYSLVDSVAERSRLTHVVTCTKCGNVRRFGNAARAILTIHLLSQAPVEGNSANIELTAVLA